MTRQIDSSGRHRTKIVLPRLIPMALWILAILSLTGAGFVAFRTWAPESTKVAVGLPAHTDLLLIAIVSMSLVTLVAILVAFYLYRWRRWMISGKSHLVPEAWVAQVRQLEFGQRELSDRLAQVGRRTLEELESNSRKTGEVAQIVATLGEALEEREAEIRRLRRGYDAEVFRQFVGRFIRLHRAIEESSSHEVLGDGSLSMIKRLCEDALEECGVETFLPEIGSDYRKTNGVADNPEVRLTMDLELDFTIDEVKAPGYRLVTGETQEVLREARVAIRRFHTEREDQK